jgi:nicotinate-nucleotide adenylyltransferase
MINDTKDTKKYVKRVALFGGAFDPVTDGHIQVAEYVAGDCDVDEVWLMPCYVSYSGKKMASGEHRLNMCRLATKHNDKIKVYGVEIEKRLSCESHMVMDIIRKENKDTTFSFVIGSDNVYNMTKMKQDPLDPLNFIVIPRKGFGDISDTKILSDIIDTLNEKGHHFRLMRDYRQNDISSTNVKKNMKCHNKNDNLCEDVVKYIEMFKLYEKLG